MKINELIQRRLRQLNDTVTANRFINEASRLLGSADDGKKRLTELTTSVSAQGAGDSEKPRRGTGDQLPEILLDELAHPDWMSRYKALQELAGYPAELGRPYFLEAVTHDEDIQVRVTALDILGKLHQLPETRAVLIEALQDDELLMIDTATDLIKTWDGFETKDLLPLLDHENVQTVAAVIEILTHHVEKRAVPYLTKRLHDERKPWLSDHHIGYLAAKALIALETPEAIQAVKDSGYVVQADSETIIPPAIERDQKPSKKYSTVEKFRLTLQALHSDDWSLTQKAAKYLKKLAIESKGTKNEDIINALEAALNDPVWTVRWAAVEALAWIKSYQSVPKIESLLDDPYWMVQVATVRTLTELDARSLAPRIAKLVGDPNTSVVEAAVEALGALNNPDIKDTLHQAMEHDSEFVRLAALTSLYNLFEENAARYLVQALRDPYNHVRWFAIKHLAPIADSSHLKSVVRLLPDRTGPAWESKTISDYAIEALQHMNTKESHHILEEWVQTRGDGNS